MRKMLRFQAMRLDTRIAIIGAGLGGLVAGALLQQRGHKVTIFEQAPEFSRLGAGINLSPNVMKVLDAIGVAERLLNIGIRPRSWMSRDLATGEVLFDYPMRDQVETKFGAPYITIHRGDFHEVLTGAVTSGTIEFGMRLIAFEQQTDNVHLDFEAHDGVEVDFVIGADGINSMVRETLLGPELPKYTGYVAHRSIFPMSRLDGMDVDDFCKWWSDDVHGDRHIVVYLLDKKAEEIYFVTGVPQPDWDHGLSFVDTDMNELCGHFSGFHDNVIRLVEACPTATTWPIFERDPLPLWSRGQVVLLGDACHPMKPHMAQGAAIAIEDAAILIRCLEHCGDDLQAALRLYEDSRKERASHVQKHSHANKWLRAPMDPSWVFGYDALTQELGVAAGTP